MNYQLQNEIAQRFRDALGNRSARQISITAGLNPTQFQKFVQAENPATPSADKIPALANALGVRIEWLLTGLGPKIDSGVELAEVVNIPIYRDQHSAKTIGQRQPTGETYPLRAALIDRLQVSDKSLVVLAMRGDAMEPIIKANDLMLVKLSDTLQEGVHVLEKTLTARHCQFHSDGSVSLFAYHQNYERETVIGKKVNQLAILGQVLMTERLF